MFKELFKIKSKFAPAGDPNQFCQNKIKGREVLNIKFFYV
jgi:hypothetical protein